MFDEYIAQKRIRRFKKDITVLKKDNITIKLVDEEKYFEAYKKILKIFEKLDRTAVVNLDVVYVSNEYISFLCKLNDKCIALNFSLVSGYFEREIIVLKYVGIRKKDVLKVLKKNSVGTKNLISRIFLIPNGIGIVCDSRGESVVKIRR